MENIQNFYLLIFNCSNLAPYWCIILKLGTIHICQRVGYSSQHWDILLYWYSSLYSLTNFYNLPLNLSIFSTIWSKYIYSIVIWICIMVFSSFRSYLTSSYPKPSLLLHFLCVYDLVTLSLKFLLIMRFYGCVLLLSYIY